MDVVDDDAAFAAWYRNEHPRLLAAMAIVTGDLHVAQDVTAEAFARALAAWNRVSSMDSPTGWTYRVALNLARRRARRAALEQRAAAPDAAARRRASARARDRALGRGARAAARAPAPRSRSATRPG